MYIAYNRSHSNNESVTFLLFDSCFCGDVLYSSWLRLH